MIISGELGKIIEAYSFAYIFDLIQLINEFDNSLTFFAKLNEDVETRVEQQYPAGTGNILVCHSIIKAPTMEDEWLQVIITIECENPQAILDKLLRVHNMKAFL